MQCEKDCGCPDKSDPKYDRELPSWVYLGIGFAIGAVIYVAMIVVGLFSKVS